MTATLICILGILLILSEIIFRIYLKGRTRLIETEDEKRVLYFFILGNIGIWMFILSTGFYMIDDLNLNLKWFILIGLIPGFISGFRNYSFWTLTDGKFKRRNAHDEPAGGMVVVSFALVFMPLFGLAAGYIIYRILIMLPQI